MNNMTIETTFESWIRRARSQNTKTNYNRSVREFFDMMFDKSLEEIDKRDLMAITPNSVDDKYVDVLRDRGNKSSTIIQKMTHVSIFFEKLKVNRIFINDINYEAILKDVLSIKNLTNDSVSTQEMTLEEKDGLVEWYLNDRFSARYADKGIKYAVLTELLFVTGARISSIFNLKWSDIQQKVDRYGQRAMVINVLDKGDKSHVYPISDAFYQKLVDAMGEGDADEKVFKALSQQGFGRDLITYSNHINHEGEHFTPHSLRSLGITEYHNRNGYDLVKTSRFAGHESVETTRGYIHEDVDMFSSGSYILSSQAITADDLSGLSKEDLLKIIGSKQDMINYIYGQADEMGLI